MCFVVVRVGLRRGEGPGGAYIAQALHKISIGMKHRETHGGRTAANRHLLQIHCFPMFFAKFRATSGTLLLDLGYLLLRTLLQPDVVRCFTTLGMRVCSEYATESLEEHALHRV